MSKRIVTLGDFLNVDVELTSRRPLKALADELNKWILYHGPANGRWLLTFETNSIQGKSTPDGVIAMLCKLIENLSPAARHDWKAAKSRVFDIGFESAPPQKGQTVVVRSTISEGSLRRIAELGAHVHITCYRHFKDVPKVVKNKALNNSFSVICEAQQWKGDFVNVFPSQFVRARAQLRDFPRVAIRAQGANFAHLNMRGHRPSIRLIAEIRRRTCAETLSEI
jgi:hypothetical protein